MVNITMLGEKGTFQANTTDDLHKHIATRHPEFAQRPILFLKVQRKQ